MLLLDYRLPGMNALELLKELRQVHRVDVPMVLITGQGDEEVAVQALKLGATDYVVKNPGYLHKMPHILANAVHSAQLATEYRTVTQLKHRNELIVNSTREGIMELDLKGDHIFCNPSGASMLGYTVAEMITSHGHSLWHHTNPDGTPHNEKTCFIRRASIEGIAIHDQEDLFWKKGGTCLPVEFSLMPIHEDDHLVGSVLTFRDITERKKAEVKLKETYDIIERSPVVAFLWKNDEGWPIEFVTENVQMLFGYTAQEFTSGRVSYVESIHPDDLKKVVQEVTDYSKDQARQSFQHEPYRIVRKDGTIKWVNDNTLIRRNDKGEITHYQGTLFDITERKQTQEKLQDTLERLRMAVNTTVQVMVSAVEARDPYTAGHQIRSADLARAIATEMSLPEETIEEIYMATSIHDIGNLSVPAEILSKPSRLSDTEFSIVKEHALRGYEILKDVESDWPLAEIVYQHHERIDGSGYPRSLKGEEILLEARILAVADVVEAISSHRPYRPALGIEAALEEISKNSGILYDSTVVEACITVLQKK